MPDNTLTILYTLFAISFLTRVSPTWISSFLQKQVWMSKLSKSLPSMILVLLFIHDVQGRCSQSPVSLIPIFISIAAALLIHFWKHNVILSIAVGVVMYFLTTHYLIS